MLACIIVNENYFYIYHFIQIVIIIILKTIILIVVIDVVITYINKVLNLNNFKTFIFL